MTTPARNRHPALARKLDALTKPTTSHDFVSNTVTADIVCDLTDIDNDHETGLTAEAYDRLHTALSSAGLMLERVSLCGDIAEPDRKEDQ